MTDLHMNDRPGAVPGGCATKETRAVVEELLRRISADDPVDIAGLYAEEVDWRLGWPDDEHGATVPWIRHRSTRADIEDHYRTLAEHHVPGAATVAIDRILVDGPYAAVAGELGQTLRSTGVGYRAGFALHLTVVDDEIVAQSIVEDSLAVLRAFRGDVTGAPTTPAARTSPSSDSG